MVCISGTKLPGREAYQASSSKGPGGRFTELQAWMAGHFLALVALCGCRGEVGRGVWMGWGWLPLRQRLPPKE